jgi:large subunit ribosomal protein L3
VYVPIILQAQIEKHERYYWEKSWNDQHLRSSGKQTACTIIEAGPCVVTQVRTKENDGYEALQLSFGDKNENILTLAEKNHFAKASTSPKKFSKEFRNTSLEKNIGETVTVDIFSEGDKVEVIGTTKGKGFPGRS